MKAKRVSLRRKVFSKKDSLNPRDFIDLIELISNKGLEKVEKSIKELEK